MEAVCVEISKPHSRPFLVTTIYRPLNSSHDFFENFEKLVKAIDDENKEMYILGDLNCDMLKTESNTPTKKIKSLYELYQLSQVIKETTWVTMTTSSLIDHIVTNTPKKSSDSGVIHTGISDHSLVFTTRKIHIFKKQDENIVEIRNSLMTKNLLKIYLISIGNMYTSSLIIQTLCGRFGRGYLFTEPRIRARILRIFCLALYMKSNMAKQQVADNRLKRIEALYRNVRLPESVRGKGG